MKKRETLWPITDELRAKATAELTKMAERGKTRQERTQAKNLLAQMQATEQAREQPPVVDPEFLALVERVQRIRQAKQVSQTRKGEGAAEQ
jgi:hypothetical protein